MESISSRRSLSPKSEPMSHPVFPPPLSRPTPGQYPDSALIYIDMLGLIIVCALVSLLLFFINRNFNHNPQRNGNTSESDNELGERDGLERDDLEQMMPIVNYSSQQDVAPTGNYCVICLENFFDGVPTRVFPMCKHIFHSACIDEWLSDHLTCPICRVSILNS